MNTWDELSEKQQESAIEKIIDQDLNLIVEGRLQFNDEQNEDNLQEVIDGVIADAQAQQTPWFALEMIWNAKYTPSKGHVTDNDGKWPISSTLRGLAKSVCMDALYPVAGEWVIEGIA